MLKIKIASSYFSIIFMVVLVACDPVTIPTQPTTDIGNTTQARTLVPVASSTVIRPTTTPTMEVQSQSPACTFPLAQTTTEESKPEEYTFSQPSLVLTGESYQPDIVEWLPDSQNVIIMPVKLIDLGIKGYQETIELFNPQSKETRVYAIRREGEGPPTWNAELKAIVYPATKTIGTDLASVQFLSQLRISYGNPDATQLLVDDLPAQSLTLRPDGGEVFYQASKGKRAFPLYGMAISKGSLEVKQSISFDVRQFGFKDDHIFYQTVWRSGTSQIFFHSYVSPAEQTFLLDRNTGQSCTLDFGGWVYFARWSPNGRYLAVITSSGAQTPIWGDYDLRILDALTGKLYLMDSTKVGPPAMKNCCRHIIGDFSWAPDNRHLIVMGTAGFAGTGMYTPVDKLYLVDFVSGDVVDLFPLYRFNISGWGMGLAWSPDGLKVLANCPTEKQGRFCFMSVKGTPEH